MRWGFEAVEPAERARIESALSSAVALSLHAGDAFEQGRAQATRLLLVQDGLVVTSSSDGGGRRMVIALAGAGSLFVPPGPDEQLDALTDAHLLLVTEAAYRALLEVPAAAAALVEGLTLGLRDAQESLRQCSNPRHVDRVRQKLIQLARTHGKPGGDGVWLSLPLTHELLAGMTGSTRETVTRAMSELAREGFVRHEHGAYRLALSPPPAGP